MISFKTKFLEINKKRGVVVVEHKIFGKTEYNVDELNTLYNNDRIGVCVKKQELYILTKDIRNVKYTENVFNINSENKKITIISKN